jgi:hypothetical protein
MIPVGRHLRRPLRAARNEGTEMTARLCYPIAVLAALAAAVLAPSPAAQSLTDEKELTKSVIRTERQAILTANLGLTEAESRVFWPLFRGYGAEMDVLTDRRLRLVEDYARQYATLTDDQAAGLMNEYLAIQKDEVKARQKWFERFRKDLPARTVLRFLQIENKLDAMLQAEAAHSIPLVRKGNEPTRPAPQN